MARLTSYTTDVLPAPSCRRQRKCSRRHDTFSCDLRSCVGKKFVAAVGASLHVWIWFVAQRVYYELLKGLSSVNIK